MARTKVATPRDANGDEVQPKWLLADNLLPRMWAKYAVELTFDDEIRGGTPKSPDVIDAWLRVKMGEGSAVEQLAQTTKEQMGVASISEEERKKLKELVWCGFKRGKDGMLMHEGRCIKAMLKECSNILKDFVGVTALKSKVADHFFVVEDEISLGVPEPTGASQGFVHTITPAGPVDALKMTDYVKGATIRFTVQCLNEPMATRDKLSKIDTGELLKLLLAYGCFIGTGAERGQSRGRFTVTKLERLP